MPRSCETAGAVDALFRRLDAALKAAGCLAMERDTLAGCRAVEPIVAAQVSCL